MEREKLIELTLSRREIGHRETGLMALLVSAAGVGRKRVWAKQRLFGGMRHIDPAGTVGN